jgi:hypothetical protein
MESYSCAERARRSAVRDEGEEAVAEGLRRGARTGDECTLPLRGDEGADIQWLLVACLPRLRQVVPVAASWSGGDEARCSLAESD